MANCIGALDQGTTSTRFTVFDSNGRIVCCVQKEHRQIYPQPGWVEHDPEEIWRAARDVMQETTAARGLTAPDFAAIVITNQRETTVVWNRKTGKAVTNAIVWQDTRTSGYVSDLARQGGQDRFRGKTGLPLSTYFSSLKIRWILDHVSGSREQAEAGDLLFGNIDTFLVWHLTGGPHGGIHVTDVTNASRTQLMNLETLAWDKELLDVFGITGALVQWLRDNLSLISASSEVEALARSVEDNGGVYFVPAFSGLYAPYWKHNARGVITGLTRYANKGHLARAVLEATTFQTREVVEAMEKDCGASLEVLRVDGGMVENDLLMQFQADILNRPVVKSSINETTSLGAAYAAGLAVGFFKNTEDLCQKWTAAHTWTPNLDDKARREMYRLWKKAVARALDWID